MGQVREVELTEADISAAMNETEKEIAGAAWGNEETEALDSTGDRSLESIGEGLEGQHDEDDDTTEGDELEEGSETEGEGETEQPIAAKKTEGEQPVVVKTQQEQEPRGRVPSGKLREANERARLAEEERDRLKQQVETRSKDPELETLKTQVATLTQLLQGQRQPPPVQEKKAEPAAVPDIFENPQGFVEHLTNQIRSEVGGVQKSLQEQSVNTSFRIAHVRHGAAFNEAWTDVNKLDPNKPDDRAIAQRIYNSADPGEALVSWHKRQKTLAVVGDDPTAYAERIREETRKALMSDPEFRKELVASLRQDAQQGDDGRPRTTTRLPTSVSRAAGSNVGASREHFGAMDDSDQSVADAAWR